MKQAVVNDLTTDEIRDKIRDERAAYSKMKIAHTISPVENPTKLRASRRAIARLATELNKRNSQQKAAE